MQGHQNYQPELFSALNVEQLIPKTHLLRRVDRILNLSFVKEFTKDIYCADNGRPLVDPELFVRMLLVSYFYGVKSDRRLCEEVSLNIAYRWFCKLSLTDVVPDHSSLSKIKDRLGPNLFKKVFDQVIEICIKNKLVKRSDVKVMVDSSLIKADAALNSLVKKDATDDEIKNRPTLNRGQKYSNKTHKSCSDNDATLSSKPGAVTALYHKVHNAIDAESRVIVDTITTTGSVVDGQALQPHVERLEAEGFKVSEMIADRAYGTGENLTYLEDKKIKHFVPLFHKDVGGHLDNFKYDKKNDLFICRANKSLVRKFLDQENFVRYSASTKDCRGCEFYKDCFPKGSKVPRGKSLNVSIFREIQSVVREKEKTEEFKQKLNERMWKIEGVFGEAKNNHNLRKAKYRGLEKIQIQAYMTATVQNLKRVLTSGLNSLSGFIFSLRFESLVLIKL